MNFGNLFNKGVAQSYMDTAIFGLYNGQKLENPAITVRLNIEVPSI